MDLYFEVIVQVDHEFVDQYQWIFLINDLNIHREYLEVPT